MTIYKIDFSKDGMDEWNNLSPDIQNILAKKLKKISKNPHIPKSRLSGGKLKNCYKIKLRKLGYRLVYQVIDKEIVIIVVGVGKRDNIYKKIMKRF